ncbi:hypothetical protein [Rhizobium rhizogenes]|uniref:hypothetical protein n=1 Tax=Rhizobium rhizogenes TaxID=359 RepID=UPI0004D5F960|nr:hypothetical protein [Rhizobium rhizogenes]KEA07153.1 hypothetical protein CN09_09415 [Rhizobium rhizogenes]NTI80411.1 hypothetical protein [Rhizobium rhizogenes]NTJ22597.1 hypothetical protein [Rhizobium rhizogenes]QUE81303.1 hypothetical protein EML492_05705 [Rhizobium rhizogenes]TQO80599.1 hypothetical protein FFE80_05720 [Rhizobium rhizogenes]
MSDFLLGLQWAGVAFGMFVMAMVVVMIIRALGKLMYGQSLGGEEPGASEGDLQNFSLRALEDEFHGEGR